MKKTFGKNYWQTFARSLILADVDVAVTLLINSTVPMLYWSTSSDTVP